MPSDRPHGRFASRLRIAGVLALTVTGLTCHDSTPVGPGLPTQLSLAIAPQLERAAVSGGPTFVSLNKVIGTLTPVGGGRSYTVVSPFVRDTAILSFDVAFAGPTQRYTLALAATDTAGDTLFKSTRDIVASPGPNEPLHDVLEYVAPDTAVRFLSVTLSDTALLSGDSLTLSAIGYDGTERSITPLYIGWTSRDSLIAKVSSRGPSSAKIFGGTLESDVWIVGRAFNGAADSVLVPVRLKVGSVVLNADTLRLFAGEIATLSADVRSAAGATIDRPITWQSLDTTVATVLGILGGAARGQSANAGALAGSVGQVIAVRPGTTRIVATSGAKSDTANVVVAQVPVAAVVITPDTLALLIGQQGRLFAQALDGNGNLLSGRTIAWQSSNTLVATVSGDGTVTGLGAGLATLTATSEGIVASATVRVDQLVSTIVRTAISPPTAQLFALGDVVQFVARSFASDSTLVPGTYTYAVNAGTGIVRVDGAGQATAIGVGIGRVVVTESGGTSDTATITVTQVPQRVQVSQAAPLDAFGQTAIFHATVFDNRGSPVPGAPLNWTVQDASVGTIVAAAGDSLVVRAVGNGSSVVDVASGNVTSVTRLDVSQVAKSATLTPNAITLGLDGRARLVPALFDGGGSPMSFIQKDVQWTIEGQAFVEVDSTGEVHARAFGVTGVFATIQGVRTPTATVSVSDTAQTAIIISADTLTVGPIGLPISVYLSLSTPLPVTVVLSDPQGLVRFDKDTLVFDPGTTKRDVIIYGLGDGTTTVTASDVGKLFAPDTLTVFVNKTGTKIIPPVGRTVIVPDDRPLGPLSP